MLSEGLLQGLVGGKALHQLLSSCWAQAVAVQFQELQLSVRGKPQRNNHAESESVAEHNCFGMK